MAKMNNAGRSIGSGTGTRMTESRVTGLADARKLLNQLPINVQKRVLKAATRSGAAVLRVAVRKAAPVSEVMSKMSRTWGHLRDNVRVVQLKKDVPKDSAMFRVDTGNAPQGYWREFGTSRQPAKPWFRPAVDSAFARAVDRMKERLALGVAREAEKLGKSQR